LNVGQVEVPEWYTAGQMPPTRDMTSFERDMAALHLQREAASENGNAADRAPRQPPCLEHWDIVSGGDALADCSDTVRTCPSRCMYLAQHSNVS
jgi:hypothetical protein